MGKFLNGVFIGIGIGLFVAPQKGEETRRLIMERVAALRNSTASEDGQPIAINTRPSQTSLPAQPLTTSSTPETITVPPVRPSVTSSTQPQRQETTNVPPVRPSVTSSVPPQRQETTIVPPVRSSVTSSTQPERQETTNVPPADTRSTVGNQNISSMSSNRNATNAAQTSEQKMSANFAPGANLEQQTTTESSDTESENTTKLPPISNPSNTPGQNPNRKAATGRPNPNKARGHNKR